MATINLNVTIKDGSLDVDQSGNANHVPKTAGSSTITSPKTEIGYFICAPHTVATHHECPPASDF